MTSPAAATTPSKPGAPLFPFGWHWMQIALLVSGIVGLGAGLWQSTWWSHSPDMMQRPHTDAKEIVDWLQHGNTVHNDHRVMLKWTNLAQLTISAALVIGGTLMGARFGGLRLSMIAVGWLGIVYAVIGSSVYVWYLVSWATWAAEVPDTADPAGILQLPSASSGWALAITLGLLGLGKLLFFIVVVGYFGRFDVRAYLEDPPAWFFAPMPASNPASSPSAAP